MKKIIIKIVTAALLLAALTVITSCTQWDPPYEELDNNGKTVSIKYVAGDGLMSGSSGVSITDVFDIEDATQNSRGEWEIKLVSPDDKEKRGEANTLEVSKAKHFLAGWYVRELSVDENGNPLDEDGVLTSVSGKAQAYRIGKRWDFEKDRLIVDPNKEYSSYSPVLTLTAVWIPYFNFDFYCENEDGEWEKIGTHQGITLDIPEWKASDGKLNMKSFPKISGKTFEGAYLDAGKTSALTSAISGEVDYEKGVAKNNTIKIYTTYLDGEWYKISTANQLYSNASLKGNYIIENDISFNGKVWPTVFTNGRFTGKIIGNGHTISDINTQSTSAQYGGLFGEVGSNASITDVKFENITYTVTGSKSSEAFFGLLFGYVNDGATLEGVSITGSKLIVKNSFCEDFMAKLLEGTFKVGLITGNGNHDIAYEDITYELSVGAYESAAVTLSLDEDDYLVFTFIQS